MRRARRREPKPLLGRDAAAFRATRQPRRFSDASVVAQRGFAMLVRSAFLESGDRYRRIWSVNPPSFVLQFCERVVMLEGRLVRRGEVDPFADKDGSTASSATAYCWLVWIEGESDTRLRWLAPCMERLERPGDYPAYAVEQLEPPADGLFGAAA